MRRSHWAAMMLVLAASLSAGGLFAQQDKSEGVKLSKTAGPEPGKAQPPAKEPELTLDDYKLPENALIVICDSLAKAQKLIPQGVYLTIEKFQEYKELENKVKQLESQLKPKKLKPHSCQLTGQLQGEAVELEARFVLVTEQSNSLVTLGCQGGFLMKADMQGHFPFLQHNAQDGFLVQVPKAGKHELVLSLKVPVKSLREETLPGGIERSFMLSLPGAAATPPLELKLPAQVKELRWNEFIEKQPVIQGGQSNWKVPLTGDMDKVKISWRDASGPAPTGTLVAASWDISVQILSKHIITSAGLNLKDARGKPADWRILVPKGAKLEVKGGDPSYQITLEKTFDATELYRVKGPPAQLLELVASVVREKQKTNRFPVGPFLIFGMERQEAVYEIQAVPEVLQGQRVLYHKNLDLRALELTDSDKKKGTNVIERFEAWELVQGNAAALANAGKIGPHLELELKPLQAQVETAVEHTLRLQPAKQGWNLVAVSKIHVTPMFGVDFLDVRLPPPAPVWVPPALLGQAGLSGNILDAIAWLGHDTEWPVQPQSEFSVVGEGAAALASLLPVGDKEPVRRIDLKKPQTAPFTITLTRKYSVAPHVRQLALDLPRPVSLSDKGAKIVFEIEDPGLEAVAVEQGASVTKKTKYTLTSSWVAAPDAVRLAWQPFRGELPVVVIADVTVQPRLVIVRQQLEFDLSQHGKPKPGPANTHQVQLAIPNGIGTFQVISGGNLLETDPAAKLATVEVSSKTPLVLEYDYPLPQAAKAIDAEAHGGMAAPALSTTKLPLFWPVATTGLETKVRIWTEMGLTVSVPDTPENQHWKHTGIEAAANKASLPVVVVQSEELQPDLTMQLDVTSAPALAGVLVDRALLQVVVEEGGKRHFHGRFLITKIDVDTLDIQFPVPLAQLKQSLSVRLDNKALIAQELPDGVTARFKILQPKIYTQPVLLDIYFEIEAEESSLLHFGQVLLQSPQLKGDIHLGRVRWQLLLPPSQVPLVLGSQMYSPQQWRWQGWLFAPESQVSSDDLQQWVTLAPAPRTGQPAGTVFWGTGTNAVRLMLIPRQAWLLLCSGAFLLIGLGLSFLPRRRPGFWLALVALSAAVLATVLLWPGTLPPILYGIQPGVVVLAAILLLQWLLHRRYRRQMLFMPGFARLRKGSSISKREGGGRETSTIDAGPALLGKVGSSKIGP